MSLSHQTAARALAKMIADGVNSRRELQDELGLAKASVSRIVDGLIRRGVVSEGEKIDADTRGRKAVSLKVRPDAAYVIGTDLEGLAVRACILDARRQAVATAKRDISRRWSAKTILETWRTLLDELLAESGVPRTHIAGIGVGLPGVVNAEGFRTHAILPPGEWVDLDVRELLERFGLPAIAGNNTLCAADYERRLGAAQGRGSFLLVLVRSGIGAAMFGNGRFLVGEEMFTCELGHMRIDSSGRQCVCGKRGCLDVIASGRTLPPSNQRRGSAWQRDLQVRVGALGVGIANVLKLFHAPLVILDGLYSEYRDFVDPALAAALHSELDGLGLAPPELAFGENVNFKTSMGAALRAADAFLVDHFLATELAPGRKPRTSSASRR